MIRRPRRACKNQTPCYWRKRRVFLCGKKKARNTRPLPESNIFLTDCTLNTLDTNGIMSTPCFTTRIQAAVGHAVSTRRLIYEICSREPLENMLTLCVFLLSGDSGTPIGSEQDLMRSYTSHHKKPPQYWSTRSSHVKPSFHSFHFLTSTNWLKLDLNCDTRISLVQFNFPLQVALMGIHQFCF
jgi:hypothetical protein